jgi:hypothetical protein
MSHHPPEDKKVSRDELRRIFNDGGWAERLKSCTKIDYWDKPVAQNRGFPIGTRTIGFEYKDSGGNYIALVFYTKHVNGSVTDASPKELLVDGTWHYC